jgi:hypothetical protein
MICLETFIRSEAEAEAAKIIRLLGQIGPFELFAIQKDLDCDKLDLVLKSGFSLFTFFHLFRTVQCTPSIADVLDEDRVYSLQ